MAQNYSVLIPWENVRSALDLLDKSAAGAYKPRPVGNRVVVDLELEEDALLVTRSFAHARLQRVAP